GQSRKPACKRVHPGGEMPPKKIALRANECLRMCRQAGLKRSKIGHELKLDRQHVRPFAQRARVYLQAEMLIIAQQLLEQGLLALLAVMRFSHRDGRIARLEGGGIKYPHIFGRGSGRQRLGLQIQERRRIRQACRRFIERREQRPVAERIQQLIRRMREHLREQAIQFTARGGGRKRLAAFLSGRYRTRARHASIPMLWKSPEIAFSPDRSLFAPSQMAKAMPDCVPGRSTACPWPAAISG